VLFSVYPNLHLGNSPPGVSSPFPQIETTRVRFERTAQVSADEANPINLGMQLGLPDSHVTYYNGLVAFGFIELPYVKRSSAPGEAPTPIYKFMYL